MSLFDKLVDQALSSHAELTVLRPVVEKELLHHDILREMSEAGLLTGLTFIGGTCLRSCYGSVRLSENLDFTGGADFCREDLAELATTLETRLRIRYDLPVSVSEPTRTGGKVSTWKLRIETRPARSHLPAQRIHLDVCAIPSHDAQPMMLRNLYPVDLGTSGLILRAESKAEIFVDKVIALAFRRSRVKNRDLWDLAWLYQQGQTLSAGLLPRKINDHCRTREEFVELLSHRMSQLASSSDARDHFIEEMRRFLPTTTVRETIENADYWRYLLYVVNEVGNQAIRGI